MEIMCFFVNYRLFFPPAKSKFLKNSNSLPKFLASIPDSYGTERSSVVVVA